MIKPRNLSRHLLSDTVADELEKMISSNEITIGEKLPAEESLAKSFGVSRNVLREALKTLRERGLIEIRVGDGAYVIQLGEDHFRRTFSRLVHFGEIDITSIYEVRLYLEAGGCASASAKITDSELEHLKTLVHKMKAAIDHELSWVELELEFHLSIAKADRNPLLLSLMDAITNLLTELFEIFYMGPRAGRENGLLAHARILEALIARDANRAYEEMKEHLLQSKNRVENLLEEVRRKEPEKYRNLKIK